jgi:tetratricopeptide (TPR) repeat protein
MLSLVFRGDRRMLRGYVAAALLVLAAGPALAQPGQAEAPARKAFTVIPNVGAVPGVIVTYQSLSKDCQLQADAALAGTVTREDALLACDAAISSGALEPIHLASSYVNRGALLMTTDYARAKQDFTRAINAAPYLPEAYLNRGAILVAEGQNTEGVADLNKAIELGTTKLELAHYTRGMGREGLSDFKGAYADYKMAATLNPTWDKPTLELARFTVVSR